MSCHCHECHEHTHEDKGERNTLILRFVAGIILFAAAAIFKINCLYIASYLIMGYDVIINAVKDIKNIFNECFLMSIASIGAIVIGEYPEAAAVMLFYQFGEMLSDYAVDKSKENIGKLMDLRSDTAKVVSGGKLVKKQCTDIKIGEILRVSAGEKIPLDGVVVNGTANIDTSALTGESIPTAVSPGSEVLSGCINTDCVIDVKVTKEYSDSTASKILELVKDSKKSKTERFITRFAKVYTPIVVLAALLVAIIPSLITGEWRENIYTAGTFLVISCPCALVVSVPLTFFSGLGCASKSGILVKGSVSLENLAKIKTAVFDKTGTLTKGQFGVTTIHAEHDEDDVLRSAAYAEYYSAHPIARAIVKKYGGEIDISRISNYKETAGKGVSATIDGHTVCVGSADFADAKVQRANTVYVKKDGKYIGCIETDDALRTGAQTGIQRLNELGIDVAMMTGDSPQNAERFADILNIPYFAGLLPHEKLQEFTKIKNGAKAAFIGDGINDAPVLSAADIGISMGGIASDAAVESSDAVLMSDDLSRIALGVKIARKTMVILKENIIAAIAIKTAIMLLGVFGYASMWLAVFADVGVCLLVILNSLRAFFVKEKRN